MVSVIDAEQLFELAFRKAGKETRRVKRIKNKRKFLIEKEKAKIRFFSNFLSSELKEYVKSFPSFEKMGPFYRELIETEASIGELKGTLGRINKIAGIVFILRNKGIESVVRAKNEKEIFSGSRKFFGRIFSLKKDLSEPIKKLNEVKRKIKKFPDIRFDVPSLIIAGYPNTGKTSLLERLTGSKPEIAAYPFTTKKIELGYFSFKYREFQVIDTPGLLDRKENERNRIERKAVTALKNLKGAIIFVLDPTPYCGYSLTGQVNLLKEMEKFEMPLVVVINKGDLAERKEIEKAVELIEEKYCITGKGENGQKLKECILKQLNLV